MTEKNGSGESFSAKVIAYGKIAKSLYGLGEAALAMEVCESGIKKFPENASILITKAELLLQKFNTEGKGELVKAALACLESALKLDPHNYFAKILASQIYLKAKKTARAKELLEEILKTTPDDEKAGAMMAVITEKEKAVEEAKAKAEREAEEAQKSAQREAEAAKKAEEDKKADEARAAAAAEEEAKAKAEREAKAKAEEEAKAAAIADADEEGGGVVVVGGQQAGGDSRMGDTKPESVQWVLDDKVVIGGQEEAEDDMMHETLSAKLTVFSRLEGLLGIFLLDRNGQPIKVLNKAKLNENVFPSLVFNLFKASTNGVRRSGLGSFQKGILVSPIGTIVIVNAFYATLAVIVDNDANIGAVETRIQRYLAEVT